ncbi:MAG TPA: hypothetical protein VFS43_30205 [Polyangiaceae bacterium]|nr:hypothetical protein [Polyangiaceae bacterium]
MLEERELLLEELGAGVVPRSPSGEQGAAGGERPRLGQHAGEGVEGGASGDQGVAAGAQRVELGAGRVSLASSLAPTMRAAPVARVVGERLGGRELGAELLAADER